MSSNKPQTSGRFTNRHKVKELLLTRDWSGTSLGPIENWSPGLRFATDLCVNSEFPIAIWWGKDLVCIYNESFRRILNLSNWEGFGSSGGEFLLAVSIDIGQSLRKILREEGGLEQTRYLTMGQGGKNLSFYNSPVYEDPGRIGGVFTTVTLSGEPSNPTKSRGSDKTNVVKLDKTQTNTAERKSFEEQYEELQKSEERYTKMIEEVEDYAIILLDINGTILNWNRGAEKIKGYKEDEIIGHNFSIFYLDEDRARNLPQILIQTAINEGRASHEGYRIRRDKTRFWGSIVITALHNDLGEVIGFTKVTRDLTERKGAEDLVRQHAAELEVKNKQLEQFAYIASHDLQEPLRKIQTFVQILEKKFDDKEIREKYFTKINSSANRMAELIQSVLQYSRLAQPNELATSVNLNEVMESVIGDYEVAISDKNAEVEYDQLPVIHGIRPQLGQLFANLVGNSLKFTREKPKIKIWSRELSGEEMMKQFPTADSSKIYVELCFNDNGIGFDQQYTEKIFSIFQRLNSRDEFAGTGIGLALSKKIVENHNGFITAQGEPDKGATFSIYLPYK